MKYKTGERVMVLGAGYGALAVIKALAKDGINIILFYSASDNHARFSRFVTERHRIPNPIDNSAKLLDILMDPKQPWDGQLLIPTLDEYVLFISQNEKELKKRYFFTIKGFEVTNRIINKNLLYTHARELGIPLPKFFIPDSNQYLEERRKEFVYPCILKPADSHLFDRIYGKKNILICDYQELVDGFNDVQHHNLEVMVSEIIPGEDSLIYTYRSYIDSQNEILAEFCTQKIRQYPTGFGQGAIQKTVPMINEIRNQALNLLKSYNYQGESSVEFKLDLRDNQYKLMEINIRPGVAGAIYLKAGINIPYITYLDKVKGIRTVISTYRPEIYWIHNFWEVINFIQAWRIGNLNLREYLIPYGKEKVFAISFFDDPIHFLIETYLNFNRAAKKAIKRNLL